MTKDSYQENYRWFTDAVNENFQFLTTDYGYKYIKTDLHGYEVSIIYRFSDLRGVIITYEYNGYPIVEFGGRKEGVEKTCKWSVENIIERRCPDDNIIKVIMEMSPSRSSKYISKEEALAILRHYAKILRSHGADLLNGDYSLFS